MILNLRKYNSTMLKTIIKCNKIVINFNQLLMEKEKVFITDYKLINKYYIKLLYKTLSCYIKHIIAYIIYINALII